jgi:hypothetical protein
MRRTDNIKVNDAEMGYGGLSSTDLALVFKLVKSSDSVSDFVVIKFSPQYRTFCEPG